MYVYEHTCAYAYLQLILFLNILLGSKLHISHYLFIRISGNASIINEMATVIVSDLQCGVTYNITVAGTLKGVQVATGSSYENINTGPCPVVTSM